MQFWSIYLTVILSPLVLSVQSTRSPFVLNIWLRYSDMPSNFGHGRLYRWAPWIYSKQRQTPTPEQWVDIIEWGGYLRQSKAGNQEGTFLFGKYCIACAADYSGDWSCKNATDPPRYHILRGVSMQSHRHSTCGHVFWKRFCCKIRQALGSNDALERAIWDVVEERTPMNIEAIKVHRCSECFLYQQIAAITVSLLSCVCALCIY